MRHFLCTILLAAVTAITITSCLKDDEVSTAPQCAITSFTVADIKTQRTTSTDSTSSTYTATISGSEIFFNIDQINNRIYTVDSLPEWVNISRVVPTVKYSGYIYVRIGGEGLFTSFNSGKDSIDFTQKVEFRVVATDGESFKTYNAVINKAETNSDTLVWKQETGFPAHNPHRSVAVGNTIYVFEQTEGQPVVYTADATAESVTWSAATALSGSTATLDYSQVTIFQDNLYTLSADGYIYRAADATGANWEKVSDLAFTQLLAADNNYIYALDGTGIMQTSDFSNWALAGNKNLQMLPQAPVSCATYALRTNSTMQHTIMMGLSSNNTSNAVVWYRVSAKDENNAQPFNYIAITNDNSYPMPALNNLQMVHYDGALLAWGEPYDTIYRSEDNGITWHEVTSRMVLPEDLASETTQYTSSVVAAGRLWIMSTTGTVWNGVIQSQK